MFRGLASLTLDSKGRMAIPTRYREQLLRQCNGQMVVTVDHDHCLLLYTLPDWEEIERKLVRLPSFNKQARRMQRLLIGHATECEMDGNGRILLPPALREFAGLDKAVVLIGQGNKFEVWADEKWTARRSEWLTEPDDDGALPDELGSLSL
jgi:MraZ protein